MRTTDALIIGMELGRIRGALDAWEESKHPRADNGQFTSGAGGSGSTSTKGASKISDKHKKALQNQLEAHIFSKNPNGAGERTQIASNEMEFAGITNEEMVKMLNAYDPKYEYRIDVEEKKGNFWTNGAKIKKQYLVREKKSGTTKKPAEKASKPATSKWKKASQEYKDNVNNMIYGVEYGGDIETVAENDFNSPKGSKRYKEIMKIAKAYKNKKMSKAEAREALMGHYMDAWKGV